MKLGFDMINGFVASVFVVAISAIASVIGITSDVVYAADPTLTLSLSTDTLSLDLIPDNPNGTFASSSDLTIGVTLTGAGGYTVNLDSDDSNNNPSALVNNNDSSEYFSSLSQATTRSAFSSSSNTSYNGHWGYRPSYYNSTENTTDTFYPAPGAAGDTLITTSTAGDGNTTDEYTISIGARADLDTTIGLYSGTFVITAVANLACNSNAATINEALCLQDFSGANSDTIINSMKEGKQYRLKDNRDWKTYYIAKMKDGRVWMTQNLDLDLETIPAEVSELTHKNTDLGWTTLDATATWTPSVATATTASAYGANSNTTPASFDYGEIYRYVSTTGANTSYSSTSACESAHNDGTCPHFHVGNYYNWSAAVASNDTSSITANYTMAPDSICPAGWKLPDGKTSTDSTNSGYYGETNYTWVGEGLTTNYVTSAGNATYATDGWINIRNNPMYMVAGGYKNGTSAVASIGSNGNYWTNTIYSSITAYAPYFSSSSLNPTFYDATYSARGRGLSVRCIARQANTGSTTITFDANASTTETGTATGTMSNQIIPANTLATLSSNAYAIAGYGFNSWNTKSDGSGTSYADAASYYARVGTANTNVTLYAIWDKVYTITFSVGSNATSIYFDGVAYNDGDTVIAVEGTSHVIGGDFPSRGGFYSWNVTAGTLENSSYPATKYTVTDDATITLTGQITSTDMTTISASGSVSSNCKNEPIKNRQLVYDPRDNEAYWVAELCDGNVWMLDNLRLDLTDSSIINTLSDTNTNADATSLNYLKNGGGTTGNKYAVGGLTGSNWTSGGSYSSPLVNVGGSVTAGANNTWTGSYTKDTIAPVTYGYGSGKIGVYYNYCAASAGSYCYGKGYGENTPSGAYRTIDSDICPVGWYLPTGSGSSSGKEYNLLLDAYSGGGTLGGSTTLDQHLAVKTTLSTPLSGRFDANDNMTNSQGLSGSFWTSTYQNTSNMYSFHVLRSQNEFGYPLRYYYGYSIRCILAKTADITYYPNGGGGTTYTETVDIMNDKLAPASTFNAPSNMIFIEWNTSPDGTGTSYSADAFINSLGMSDGDTLELYAIWKNTHTITFSVGSNATSILFDGVSYNNGDTVTAIENYSYVISGVFPTKYGLNSWSATAGTIANSSYLTTTYTVTSDATITVTGKEATTSISNVSASGIVSNNCQNEPIKNYQLVYDPRDNESYYVAELCDGNVWMLDNLRLDLTNSAVINSLSSSNTNATDAELNYLKNGGGTTNDRYPITGLTGSNWTSGSSYSAPRIKVSGTISGENYTKDTVAPVTYGPGSGKIGVYYNYCAASAGTYCWGNGTSSTGSPSGDPNTNIAPTGRDILGDICPAGWHMPTGGAHNVLTGSGDYYNLYNKYSGDSTLGGSTALAQHLAVKTALSTPLSGYSGSGSLAGQRMNGDFWSSTWKSTNLMYFFYISSNSITPDNTIDRRVGYSVRCLLDSQ